MKFPQPTRCRFLHRFAAARRVFTPALLTAAALALIATPAKAQLPVTTGLVLRYETVGTSPYSLNGTRVTNWNDQAGTATNANEVTSSGPTMLAGATPNGRDALDFNGSSNYLQTGALAELNNVSKLSWFVVFKSDVAGQLKVLLRTVDSGSTSRWGSYTESNNLSTHTRTSAGFRGVSKSFTDITNWHILSTVWDGTTGVGTFAGWLDTVSMATPLTTAAGAAATHQNTRIGANSTGLANYWDGPIAAILVYNTALSTTDRQAVETYLHHIYFEAKSTASDLLSFSTTLSGTTYNGVIDQNNRTVTLELPAGTDKTQLTPTCTMSDYATVSPTSGSTQNFTNPVQYTVTAEDGTTTKAYTVTVNLAASPACDLSAFGLTVNGNVYQGSFSGTDVTLQVPWDCGNLLSGLTPSYTVSGAATVTPTDPQDFTNSASTPVDYVVHAQDGIHTQTYHVRVNVTPVSTACDMLTFKWGSYVGVIDGTNITLTVPTGTVVTSLNPTCTVSPFASVTPTTPQDFTNSASTPVAYTVTAQDGAASKIYQVVVTPGSSIVADWTFDHFGGANSDGTDDSAVTTVYPFAEGGQPAVNTPFQDVSGNRHHGYLCGTVTTARPVITFTTPTGTAGLDFRGITANTANVPAQATQGANYRTSGAGANFNYGTSNTPNTPPLAASGASGTLEMLVNFNGTVRTGAIINGNGWWARAYAGTGAQTGIRVVLGTADGYFNTPAVNDSIWHRLAIVVDRSNNQLRTYVDGNQVTTINGVAGANYVNISSVSGDIGGGTAAILLGYINYDQFLGMLDRVVMSNWVLGPDTFVTNPDRTACDMLTFNWGAYVGVMDQNNLTVTLHVPNVTPLATLNPTCTVSPNATVLPASGDTPDFAANNPTTYTVTAQDGVTKKAYAVTVLADLLPASLGLAASTMAENGGVATVTATLPELSPLDVTVNLAFSGTATRAVDYTTSASSIFIPAGQTSGSMTLTAVPDGTFEAANESVVVDISSVVNGFMGDPVQVTATITDADAQPAGLPQPTGINPSTGVAWANADKYQLMFVTSTTSGYADTDIAPYNAFVNAAAAGSSLPGIPQIAWKAMASALNASATPAKVNAPVSQPVYQVDGTTLVAAGYADMWDGSIANPISLDESGGAVAAGTRAWTGSYANGTSYKPMGKADGWIQYGLASSTDGGWFSADEQLRGVARLYALSVPLTYAGTLTGYALWASNNGASSDPAADSNNNGIPNGVEYFTGATTIPPLVTTEAGLTWTWSHNRPGDAPVDGYAFQVSETLTGDWRAAAAPGEIVDDSNPDQIKITLAPPGPGVSKKFCRLVVTVMP